MYRYTLTEWLFFFYLYCFFGWIFESGYVSLKSRKPVNRGFMRGPFLPLYGSGAILVLMVTIPVRDNLFLMYIFGMIAATVLEYVTGVCMEALFKVRYWDYSNLKFNYKGQICLTSSIAWGFLTIFVVKVIHAPIEAFVVPLHNEIKTLVVFLVTIVVTADMAVSVKEAIELRDLVSYMDRAKDEFELLKERLDVVIAVADEEINQKIDSFKEKTENIREKTDGYRLAFERKQEKIIKRFLYANPTASSSRFKTVVVELKDVVNRRKNR